MPRRIYQSARIYQLLTLSWAVATSYLPVCTYMSATDLELGGSHVVFTSLHVYVSQQQPAALQVLGVFEVPGRLCYALQLVTSARSLRRGITRAAMIRCAICLRKVCAILRDYVAKSVYHISKYSIGKRCCYDISYKIYY